MAITKQNIHSSYSSYLSGGKKRKGEERTGKKRKKKKEGSGVERGEKKREREEGRERREECKIISVSGASDSYSVSGVEDPLH